MGSRTILKREHLMPETTPEQKTLTEIEALTNQLEEAIKTTGMLRAEAARYRVDRRTALFENAAFKQVIEKHNIGFDISKADLSKMVLENGEVVAGGFDYTPQGVAHETKPSQPPVQSSHQGTTMEDLETWTVEDMNKNWETVLKVYKG